MLPKKSASEVWLTWKPHIHGGHPPQSFIVTYRDTVGGPQKSKHLSGSELGEGELIAAVISGLKAATMYHICVKARNDRPAELGDCQSECTSVQTRTDSMSLYIVIIIITLIVRADI